jgi:hypothetical protein
MFDTKAEIEFDALAASTGGSPQRVVLRWPTDEEWSARWRSRKYIIRRLGRGINQTVPPDPGEADVKLYQAIALNGAPVMTPAEAAKVLDTLAIADVTGVRVEGSEAKVSMMVLTGEVEHTMNIPTADQILTFRRAAYQSLELPFNQQQLRLSPDAGARLYDQCAGKSADYADGIPGTHKDAVAKALIEFIELRFGPKQDDTSF